MTLSLVEAMQKVADIQGGLNVEVDGLGAFSVQKAWPFPPTGRNGLPSLPCVINYVRFDRSHVSNNARERFYNVRSQMFLAESGTDLEEWGMVAAYFHEAYINAIGQSVMLGDTNTLFQLVDADEGAEIPAGLAFNSAEPNYYGLEFLQTLQLHDVFDPAP